MFCSVCGSNIEDESAYCPVCGAKIQVPVGQDSAFTDNNKTDIPDGDSAFGPDADSILAASSEEETPIGPDSAFGNGGALTADLKQNQQQYGGAQNSQQASKNIQPQNQQQYGGAQNSHQTAQQSQGQQYNQHPTGQSQRPRQQSQPRPQQGTGRGASGGKNPKGSGMDKKTKIAIIIAAAAAVILAVIVGIVAVKTFGKKKGFDFAKNDKIEASTNEDGDYVDEDGNIIPEDQVKKDDDENDDDVDMKDFTLDSMARPSIINDFMMVTYEPIKASAPAMRTDTISELDNSDMIEYWPDEWKQKLVKNQFIVTGGRGEEFFPIYENNRYNYTPNFLTVDSIMHTYHLYFAHVMKNTEKNYLVNDLGELSRLMQDKSEEQYNALKGTEWESAALRNLEFFAVGNHLINPDSEIPAAAADVANAELAKIEAANGVDNSSLFADIPENFEDYSQYIPRGYYDTDENLKKYFKAMMWYGRQNFARKQEELDRCALLMTLALDSETLPLWEEIYTVTSFFAGASDDSGYYEYMPVIKAAYGDDVSIDKLPGNEDAWNTFHSLTGQLEPPQINSVVVLESDTEEEKQDKIIGYRFMGQRFSIDATIFQNLCFSKTGENGSGGKRMLPDALDVPAALGSDTALKILEDRGYPEFKNYSENMQKLRDMVKEAPESTWNASLYSQWLNTLRPTLEVKGEGYPSFMQSEEWRKKNLTSFLGSYTELKHDTILYSKQMMAEMGGGEIPERDDRGYVEPEAEVYARLTGLVNATSEGLQHYGVLSDEDKANLAILAQITGTMQTIAEKELRNELPTDEEFDFIRTYGGQIEHFWYEVNKEDAETERFTTQEFPAAIVADVATDPNGSCLELATGYVETIVVLIEVDGVKKAAWGSVYSFYQFEQPLSDRLTDSKWRQKIGLELRDDGTYAGKEDMPDPEDWVDSYRSEYE